MKRLLGSLSLGLIALFFSAGSAAAQGQYISGTTGVDLAWPNCYTKLSAVAFGIVGVNNGTAYTTNSCLAKEASHFTNLSLYVNTSWYSLSSHLNAASPKACAVGDENCLAYNYGYNAGLYALSAADSVGVHSNSWWLDVETSNTWSGGTSENTNSLLGEHDALVNNGVGTVGIYSTTYQWDTITGSWQNNWPSWGATTWNSASQASTYCTGHQFTGGPSYLMQYQPRHSNVDQDVAC